MSSSAQAVQTSARQANVSDDMFDEPATVRALAYTGCVLRDAVVMQKSDGAHAVPVVLFDMECTHGAVTFVVQVRLLFTASTRAAADAKAAHCRKGKWVTVESPLTDIRIALFAAAKVVVLEGQPQ